MDLLRELNDEQIEAVTSTEGFVRVIAGAGSGKTRALSYRFAYLVNELGIMPKNILCVTFTNKSAAEMRQRIHNLTGDNDTGYINTFHGFCVSILQEDSNAVNYPKSFIVLDNSDIDTMLSVIYEERGLTMRDMTFSNARDMIEIQKLKKHPDYFLDMIKMSPEDLKAKYMDADNVSDIIFYGYLYQEKKCFGLDYNDLILFSLYIFDNNPAIKLKWQKRLEYIMIDEFQDIDAPQYELMTVLCGYHHNLFIVGDPDQTIYTWRGADVRFLLEFDKQFPNVRTIMMNENYRSTPEILAAANSLISANKHRVKKELVTANPTGVTPVYYHAKSAAEEALWIAGEIKELQQRGVELYDVAILYRSNFISRSLEEVFLREKLPYTIYSGVQFFERAEIKDALSYLRLIEFGDDLSFLRVVNRPKRNIGERRVRFLREYAEQNGKTLLASLRENIDNEIFRGTKAARFLDLIDRFAEQTSVLSVSELLGGILEQSGYEEALRTEGSGDRLDNLAELKQSVYDYETSCGEECTIGHYLTHIALLTNSDNDDRSDKVKLMTVHAAKGLEFPYVFLCGMNEGIFPTRKTKTKESMEEERRLAFVAVTRAEKGLFITEAEGRNFDGAPRYPSRFILDIDDGLVEYTEPPREGLIEETRRYIEAFDSTLADSSDFEYYKEGQRVRHRVFGDGTVLGADIPGASHIIQFDSMETPRAISFRVKMEEL